MNYRDILKSHYKYGTSDKDIKARLGYDKILRNVVIAPWWEHTIFDNINIRIEQVFHNVYNIYGDDFELTFIELKLIGAPVILDQILALGVTKCENIIFIGSVGSLDSKIKIGDIVIPKYSICGDGASRYLNKNLEDEFGKKLSPSIKITNDLIKIIQKHDVKYHYVTNYSIDTIFAQFNHIDYILSLGAKTIEMETYALFKCNELLNLNITAILVVSDNTVVNKSLYSGRSNEESTLRKNVRNNIVPKLITDLIKRTN